VGATFVVIPGAALVHPIVDALVTIHDAKEDEE